MRFRVREAAGLDPELRATFERYGETVMQMYLAHGGRFRHQDSLTSVSLNEQNIMAWLTEEHDVAERKANVSLLMEGGILILVLIEVVHIFFHWRQI